MTESNGDGGDHHLVKQFHYVFTEKGLERTSPDPNDQTKLIRVTIDIPEPVYHHVRSLASEHQTTIESVMCEWIAQNTFLRSGSG